jgi:hypothetical protein
MVVVVVLATVVCTTIEVGAAATVFFFVATDSPVVDEAGTVLVEVVISMGTIVLGDRMTPSALMESPASVNGTS